MTTAEAHRNVAPSPPLAGGNLRLYVIEALGSVGGTLMSIGIPFLTKERLHWGPGRNFALAGAQGAVYVAGAMFASRLAARVRPRAALAGVYVALAALAGIGAMAGRSDATIVAVALAYTATIGMSWPILEALVASGGEPGGLARRVALYNLVWPATGAAAMAIEGTILEWWPPGLMVGTAAIHVISAWLALGGKSAASSTAGGGTAIDASHAHPAPEPELLRIRTRALWVSRLALPATYAVIYGLMPLMPDLAVMRRFDTRAQTAISSTWLVSRWLAFILLAAGTWWHTRPRALVGAACVMLVAFLGITLPPSLLWRGATPGIDLAVMIVWQVLLGLALGMIYSGSLYFGMVLSEGSTEHGGYHEALIGVGWVLGPTAGAITQWVWPGNVTAGVIAVGAVIGLSVLAVAAADVLVGRNTGEPRSPPRS
jgi:hypothetical protein